MKKKTASEREGFLIQVLNELSHSSKKIDTIEEILNLVKEFTGFESVAIRLSEGEDFPYYVTKGFSDEFVEAEKYLCSRHRSGELIRDTEGNPYMECMCGNVLCGRTNPDFPFFTQNGSFWSNHTTELLRTTTDEDRQARTRNRCNSEGYESVALVPLVSNKKTIGLLQLNDRRKSVFTLDLIQFFEEIGVSIGIALEHKQMDENLQKANEDLNVKVQERTAELEKTNAVQAILLKEVNHRVKNNLFSIMGLLAREERWAEKKGLKSLPKVLKKLKARIEGLSSIHDLLSSSNWQPLKLSDLCEYIIKSAIIASNLTREIKTEIKSSQITINSSEAHHLTMIINELVLNTIKHNIENPNHITISVDILSSENRITLLYRDNGAGYDAEVAEGESDQLGIGMELVKGIATHSLSGDIQFSNDDGAVTVITFIPQPETTFIQENQ